MDKEQLVPETKGVTVKLLETIDLGTEIAGLAGRQFRMRLVTFEPGSVFGPLHDHKDRPGLVEMELLPIMGRDWAGPKIGTPCTGLKMEGQFLRLRSRSILSGKSKPVKRVIIHLIHLSPTHPPQ
jgi:hypothetical protein